MIRSIFRMIVSYSRAWANAVIIIHLFLSVSIYSFHCQYIGGLYNYAASYVLNTYWNWFTMSERDLVEQLKSGDITAFKEFYEKYHEMVFNVCHKMAGNREDAEDLTQETFLKAYESIHSFRSRAKISTWLYRITVNLCLKHQRRKKIIRWLSFDFLIYILL